MSPQVHHRLSGRHICIVALKASNEEGIPAETASKANRSICINEDLSGCSGVVFGVVAIAGVANCERSQAWDLEGESVLTK